MLNTIIGTIVCKTHNPTVSQMNVVSTLTGTGKTRADPRTRHWGNQSDCVKCASTTPHMHSRTKIKAELNIYLHLHLFTIQISISEILFNDVTFIWVFQKY